MKYGMIRIEKEMAAAVSPCERLATAIVLRAVEDYRKAQTDLHTNSENEQVLRRLSELERFFRSEWFEVLTTVDGRCVLAMLKREVAS